MKNIGRAGQAGSISAALLLREFVGDVPWAHLDIAGPARSDEDARYLTKGGTGFGVRTLVVRCRRLHSPSRWSAQRSDGFVASAVPWGRRDRTRVDRGPALADVEPGTDLRISRSPLPQGALEAVGDAVLGHLVIGVVGELVDQAEGASSV